MSVGGEVSDELLIAHSVKQGCVLAPSLLTLVLTAVLSESTNELMAGIYVHTRSCRQIV